MSCVRIVEDSQYREYEQAVECAVCGIDLAVMPPGKIVKRIMRGVIEDNILDIEAGLMWSQDHYFYCLGCQKEFDYPEVE